MGEVDEVSSAPITPRPPSMAPTPPITSAPPSQFHSPSLSRSPLLHSPSHPGTTGRKTPVIKSRNLTPRFLTPLGSPIRKALHLTKLDPQDAWLPITESRNGNAYYAAFHTLCSGIGIQALILPVAFTILGWTWGIITLTIAFIWQLYTLNLLVQLHESTETGIRYSRYMQLASATLGERLSNHGRRILHDDMGDLRRRGESSRPRDTGASCQKISGRATLLHTSLGIA